MIHQTHAVLYEINHRIIVFELYKKNHVLEHTIKSNSIFHIKRIGIDVTRPPLIFSQHFQFYRAMDMVHRGRKSGSETNIE